jgi:hypothetical protein
MEAEEAEPSTWRHKLIVPMLIELRALEWLDISGHLDGDIVTMLSVIKVLQVLSRRIQRQQNLLLHVVSCLSCQSPAFDLHVKHIAHSMRGTIKSN